MTSKKTAEDDLLEPLLTPVDLAKLLNTCTKTVYRIIAAGEIEIIRVGKLIRIRPSAARSYIKRNRS